MSRHRRDATEVEREEPLVRDVVMGAYGYLYRGMLLRYPLR